MAAAHATLVVLLALSACVLSEREFVRTPAFDRNKRITAILKRSVELSCEYKGSDGNVEFTGWYRNNSNVDQEIQGHYVVKQHKHYTNLTIKIFVHNDSYVHTWTAKAKKNNREITACEFKKILLVPSPQSIETDRTTETITSSNESIRRMKGEQIRLKCNIEPPLDPRNPSRPTWQFSADGEAFGDLPAGVVPDKNNEIIIDSVQTMHRGHYNCTLNGVSFTVLLRVKDHLAALWPFLGIVTVVVLLVLLILLCERRQKATRRTVGTDDEHLDHTKDPLVRAANNASDNENKKRAIKA